MQFRVRIVKLLTQHFVRGAFVCPLFGDRFVGGGTTSQEFAFMTGSKWVAAFPLA